MRSSTASILAFAGLLRAPGLFTDFWLDEIWALSNVARIDGAEGVFTSIHHDSNHWLVSLWTLACGPDLGFWVYRLPSFLAGIAAVFLAGRLARRTGSPRTLLMLLVATSFPLVFYSSEARGYSLAVLAAFASMLFFLDGLDGHDRGGKGSLLGFWGSASVGILSQLSFLLFLVAILAYGLVLAARGCASFKRLGLFYGAPLAVLALLFTVDLRYLTLGGGPHVPPLTLLAQTASLSLGGPVSSPYAWGGALVAWVVTTGELLRRIRGFWRHRDTTEPRDLLWVFYLALVALPVWLALVLDPPFLFPRYFLVCVAFVPFLVASFVASRRRPTAVVLVTLWMVVNGVATVRFFRDGRGHYEEALRLLLDRAPGGDIDVGSDEDFRNEKIVDFYRNRLGREGERLRYVRGEATYWIASAEEGCERCELLARYPSSELSGSRWFVYRRSR